MSKHEKVHLALTYLWVVLLVPSVLWWKESVFWLVLVSVYANIAGHYAAYEAARADRRSPDDPNEVEEKE